MKHAVETTPHLDLKQGLVERLLTMGDRVKGVATDLGVNWRGQTVILATGTFLGARIMTGEATFPAGRAGEFSATGLSASLRELGFTLGRLQTNTPPRIDARTIDLSQTVPQLGSETPLYFSSEELTSSFQHSEPHPTYPIPHQTDWRHQLPCYLVYTNGETHRIVRENLHRSPIASGFIEGVGPRYCPSIEEKIVRFAQKDSHQLFLEPEGWRTVEVYVQGMYTAMPYDVQLAMLRSIPALRKAEIVRPGYAVEYDFVCPDQINASLETRRLAGLFHAGQINGTSGYEEAAAQGIMAGINAARKVQGKEPIILRRDQAYIGVLIDDLVTKEITEPYRMMTSRAEYRLLLRQDNADLRLSPIGYEVGLLPRERYEAVKEKGESVEGELERLGKTWLAPSEEINRKLTARGFDALNDGVNALQFLRRPEVTYELIEALVPGHLPLPPEVIEQVTIEAKYAGYIEKQRREVERVKRLEERPIPDDFDYEAPVGLRNEAREKLKRFRPATVGQASRLSGVNPTDISILLVYLKRATRNEVAR